VRAALSAGYRALDPAAGRAFRLLGVLDVPTVTPWLLTALLECPQETADELADRLVQARLLEVAATPADGPARYRMHDLVRLFARERCECEEEEAERRRAVGRAGKANPGVSRPPRNVRPPSITPRAFR
jgi:hypothetical protein